MQAYSTESEIATVQTASAEDVDRAVKAAHAALKSGPWKTLPGTERGILMNRLADLMEKNKELLATIDTWDNGMVERLLMHVRPLEPDMPPRKAVQGCP